MGRGQQSLEPPPFPGAGGIHPLVYSGCLAEGRGGQCWGRLQLKGGQDCPPLPAPVVRGREAWQPEGSVLLRQP